MKIVKGSISVNRHGTFDATIEHPELGLIPYTIGQDDSLFKAVSDGEFGDISPYSIESEPLDVIKQDAIMLIDELFTEKNIVDIGGVLFPLDISLLNQLSALIIAADAAKQETIRLSDGQGFVDVELKKANELLAQFISLRNNLIYIVSQAKNEVELADNHKKVINAVSSIEWPIKPE